MRIPGWVSMLLLVGACDKGSSAESQAPAVTDASPPRQVSDAQIADVKRCEAAGPSEMGSVNYRMIAGASGRVESVQAAQSPVSAAVINCSVQRARAWRFAANTERTELSFSVPYDTNTPAPAPASKKTIKAAIKHQAFALQRCFNDGLRVDPTIEGKVTYAIVISVSGEVTDVKAESEGSLPRSVVDCTTGVARGWVFAMEGAKEGADVSFSVVFSQSGSSATPPG